MPTHFAGAVMLADDEVSTRYGVGDGYQFATVHLGRHVTVHVTDASPETLDQVAAAFAELAAWKRSGGLRVAS